MSNYLSCFTVILICFICAVTDWKNGKVYNKVTYPGILLGLIISVFSTSPNFPQSLVGALGSFLFYGLFWGRGLGAGDIKLMIAVGALQGITFVIFASLYILCIAGIFSIFHLAWKGKLIPVLKWVLLSMISIVVPGSSAPKLSNEEINTIPFAPFILVGVGLAIYVEYAFGKFQI